MSQINRMAHARANAGGDQLLAMTVRLKFGEAGNFCPVKSPKRRAVNRESQEKEDGRRRPGKPIRIKASRAKRPHQQKRNSDESAPHRQDESVGAPPVGAPAIHKRMQHKPEQRNSAVHRAGQQSYEIDNRARVHEETCADDGTGAGVYTDHLSAVWDLKGHGFSRAESRFITMALATEGLRCSGKFNSPQGLKDRKSV